MTEINSIKICDYSDRSEIRIDWSNERYQSIILYDRSPTAVMEALVESSKLIYDEMVNGLI